eukprot:TRINITY_DN2665_c0_g1_i1.p1 TRINITY_DN2665_c0_g1~~TRINITY_DN2665_c0_g1_i1.p1  ORF type:complete len:699 (+),score=200.31 TRINITY_DN2665_c0_g1_i1:115-2097(+)
MASASRSAVPSFRLPFPASGPQRGTVHRPLSAAVSSQRWHRPTQPSAEPPAPVAAMREQDRAFAAALAAALVPLEPDAAAGASDPAPRGGPSPMPRRPHSAASGQLRGPALAVASRARTERRPAAGCGWSAARKGPSVAVVPAPAATAAAADETAHRGCLYLHGSTAPPSLLRPYSAPRGRTPELRPSTPAQPASSSSRTGTPAPGRATPQLDAKGARGGEKRRKKRKSLSATAATLCDEVQALCSQAAELCRVPIPVAAAADERRKRDEPCPKPAAQQKVQSRTAAKTAPPAAAPPSKRRASSASADRRRSSTEEIIGMLKRATEAAAPRSRKAQPSDKGSKGHRVPTAPLRQPVVQRTADGAVLTSAAHVEFKPAPEPPPAAETEAAVEPSAPKPIPAAPPAAVANALPEALFRGERCPPAATQTGPILDARPVPKKLPPRPQSAPADGRRFLRQARPQSPAPRVFPLSAEMTARVLCGNEAMADCYPLGRVSDPHCIQAAQAPSAEKEESDDDDDEEEDILVRWEKAELLRRKIPHTVLHDLVSEEAKQRAAVAAANDLIRCVAIRRRRDMLPPEWPSPTSAARSAAAQPPLPPRTLRPPAEIEIPTDDSGDDKFPSPRREEASPRRRLPPRPASAPLLRSTGSWRADGGQWKWVPM